MAIKIDLRKAFNMLDWCFLLDVLDCFGFSLHFQELILEILSSYHISISLNGGLSGYFSCS